MGLGTVTGLVGRERESAQLGQAVEEVAGGDVRVVALIGEAGIGRSALLEHHLSRVYSKLGVRSRTELAAAWQGT